MNADKATKTKSRGNGEGTFYYVESKKLWAGQIVNTIAATGVSKRHTFYGVTKKVVKEKIEKFKKEVSENGYSSDETVTLYELAKVYVEAEYLLNRFKDVSYNRKLDTLKIIMDSSVGNIALTQITERDILIFLSSVTTYSNSVIAKIYSMTKRTFLYAMEKDIISKNIFDGMMISRPKSKRIDKKCVGFTLQEEKNFLKTILQKDTCTRNNYTVQFCIMLYTGMRMGEINALTMEDIDLKNKLIHVRKTITEDLKCKPIVGATTKTNAGCRDIIMNEDVVKILDVYIKDHYMKNPLNLLFYNFEFNRPLTTNQVNLKFQRLCEKYDICEDSEKKTNQHMLRHTFATRCIESGMPANVLQKILGHTDIGTTLNTYCDVFKQFEEKHLILATEYNALNGLNLAQFK